PTLRSFGDWDQIPPGWGEVECIGMIEPENVAAVLLAAGRSLRFGEEDKLLAHLRGVPLVGVTTRK
ncbi:MAG TPA: hypothetical protein PKW66_28900, partial [Polyangiaceae bacterium]|nr:hypothetical protein [Polyangiaceae bacterium]